MSNIHRNIFSLIKNMKPWSENQNPHKTTTTTTKKKKTAKESRNKKMPREKLVERTKDVLRRAGFVIFISENLSFRNHISEAVML